MDQPDQKPNENDILEQVKRAEKIVKTNLLIKAIAKLKSSCREVLELKEGCNALLREVGVADEDVKRVIDWINSLSEIQLTDEDRKEIRTNAKEEITKKRQEVQKEIEKTPFFGGGGGSAGIFNGYAGTAYTTTASGINSLAAFDTNSVMLTATSGSNQLEIKV